ncbi:MAG: LEA type 2 family protein [Balneolaceae bacterium]|nr:LEA type 2 family protein [Balneolaceae bacterium]MBO6547347.1 LEA type 2 family protein [Balneolaceae bacterium]MBO6647706.1 LEA type 2 family protein [Balneolaceae bacterium]
MKPYKTPFYLLLFVFLMVSCSELKELADAQKPTISVDDFRISGLSLQDIELTFDLQIDNPNPVAVTLSSYDYDLQIENSSFVKGSQPLNTTIPSKGRNNVSVPVIFTFKELYNTFTSINSKNEGAYAFIANVQINVPVLGLIEVPIEKNGTFPVVKAPTISVANFSLKDISFTKADIEVELNVANPNTFGLILNQLDYGVDIDGLSTISGEIIDRIEIGGNESQTFKIPASFSFADLGLAAYNALTSDDPFEYNLTGSANIGATLPFFESSSFNFDKTGVVDILR